MQMTGNCILITGGGSGIGRALAEKFHAAGNDVIITGRDAGRLQSVVDANPGMTAMTVDMTDASGIISFAARLIAEQPALNVVIHNAGIMIPERVTDAPAYLANAEATVLTNLLGPIRLTAALLPHLLKQPASTLLTVSSGLAFVPLAMTPTYSATKAAIHSWSVAMRQQLKGSSVQIIEIAPPYVQTELMGEHQAVDPMAMPLVNFINEVMDILANNADCEEVIVERCKPLRFAEANGNFAEMFAALSAMPVH